MTFFNKVLLGVATYWSIAIPLSIYIGQRLKQCRLKQCRKAHIIVLQAEDIVEGGASDEHHS